NLDSSIRLHIEQTPESALLRVVRAGGIASGWTNSTILLLDQIGNAEFFVAAVTPFVAHLLMQAFGKGFGQAVGNSFRHDCTVVVMVRTKPITQIAQTNAGGDCERANMIR